MQRCYATTGDYTNFTGSKAPDTLDRRSFVAGSRRVDRCLVGAVYPVGADGISTDREVREAIRDATCAVVEAWVLAGDPTGTGRVAGPEWGSVSIGDVSLSRPASATGASSGGYTDLPDKAEDLLVDAGLLPIDPYWVG